MRLDSPQINIMTRACMKASRSLIRDFGELENLQVSTKGPGDFVTSADKRTEKILIGELQKAHPDYGIITEESGQINKTNIKAARRILDKVNMLIKIDTNYSFSLINFAILALIPFTVIKSSKFADLIFFKLLNLVNNLLFKTAPIP